MLNRTLTLIATAIVTSNSYAGPVHLIENDVESISCFASEGGIQGLVSSNTAYIPPFTTEGEGSIEFIFHNSGQTDINVGIRLYDEDATIYAPGEGWTFDGMFNVNNAPFVSDTAVLSPFKIGVARFDNNAKVYYSGRIQWRADACLENPPLSVTIRYGDGSTSTPIALNGGNPF